MARSTNPIDDAALDWIVRVGDPAFDDWDGFTAWLEADPRHATCYQMLEADAAEMANLVPASAPAMPIAERRMPILRRRWIGGALAASIAAVIGFGALRSGADPYVVETLPGVTRTIALADGSSIVLNGDTRLTLDHRDQRVAALDRGEAYFVVHHNAARPFRVAVSGHELVDVGTAFDVAREGRTVRVGVAEGAVVFGSGDEAVRLKAGGALQVEGDVIRLSAIEPDSVGSWREGSLDYDGAPLRQVAADLSRATGVKLVAAPAVAERTFRGTIALDGLRDNPTRLAPLFNASVRRGGSGWEIAPLP